MGHKNRWSELQSDDEEGDDKLERIEVTVDSGAVDTVGPPRIANKFPIRETRASRAGLDYRAANGTRIKNYGEKRITGKSKTGTPISLTMQCADVTKVLGSASRITEADNTVIFSNGKSAIIKDPGAKIANKIISEADRNTTTELRKDKGVYKFDIYVEKEKEAETIKEVSQDFAWLDSDLM